MALDDSDDERPPPQASQPPRPSSHPQPQPPHQHPPSQHYPSQQIRPQQTALDKFDRNAFDPSKPEAWAQLGQAWYESTGAQPSPEDLMMYLQAGARQA
ncbi:hypothetical protein P7C73_g4948, partial [Tremellales sp. Uapishka_1]